MELTEPLHDIVTERRSDGGLFEAALVVARVRRRPVAIVPVDLDHGVLRARAVAAATAGLGADASALDGASSPAATDVDADPPFISVVVCTRDRAQHLAACLDRAVQLDYPNFEIVVVDNAPTDASTHTLVHERFGDDPRVRYVREDLPGLSRARNRGVAVARGELVAFTDDDVRVDRFWLSSLAAAFGRGADVACVTGPVFPDVLETRSQARFEEAVASATKWGFEPRIFDLDEHRAPTALYPYQVGTYGAGNNMAFRRDFLIETGGFDVALGAGSETHGGEDLDSFVRVVTTGHQLAYEPSAVVWHVHRQTDAALRKQAFGYGVGLGALLSKLLFTRDNGPKMLARVPRGVAYYFGGSSAKNAQKSADFPLSLSLLELTGLIWGPVAYVRSRRRGRVVGPRRVEEAVTA